MIVRMEERSMNAWPALQSHLYDGWVIRFAEGYTKRANSVCPIYSSAIDLEEKLDYCEKLYRSQGLPVVYKLTKACYPADLDQVLERRGYWRFAETAVRIAELAEHPSYVRPQELQVAYKFTEEWINSYLACTDMSDTGRIVVMKKLLHNIIEDKICVWIHLEDEPVACGFGVFEDGYMGIFDIVVHPKYRGRGYGRAIMQSLMMEALSKGVQKAYLSVVVGNTIAEKLYDSLGFQEIYRYWYRERS